MKTSLRTILLTAACNLAFATIASATDPCWWEVQYSANAETWYETASSMAAGCGNFFPEVVCPEIFAQTNQRDMETFCCWVDQSLPPPPVWVGFEPGWCRWPEG